MNILISITLPPERNIFQRLQETNGIPVCVIGANIDSKFFPKENAVGMYIKFDKIWLRLLVSWKKMKSTWRVWTNRCKCIQRQYLYTSQNHADAFSERAWSGTRMNQANVVCRKYGIWTSFYDQCYRVRIWAATTTSSIRLYQVNETEDLTPRLKSLAGCCSADIRRSRILKLPYLNYYWNRERTKDIFNYCILGAHRQYFFAGRGYRNYEHYVRDR